MATRMENVTRIKPGWGGEREIGSKKCPWKKQNIDHVNLARYLITLDYYSSTTQTPTKLGWSR